MKRLILQCQLSPGDIVMLTAAVRDLHRWYPGQFETDVRTSCPELWWHNPWLTPLSTSQADVRRIDCRYPLIHRANQEPWHFLHGFGQHLGAELGLSLPPTAFRGDLHLSADEREAPSPVEQFVGGPRRYWIIAAGGKYDFTVKWWHRRRWQEVVRELRHEVEFVQVGQSGHYHPRLEGAIDMRGRTTLRELVRLVYHSEGVVCPVTSLMHLAAAVPQPPGRSGERPCVVVAGGREPAHWEAYPWHTYLHTIGRLPCCASGGCWKVRAVPLGDGHANDEPSQLCTDFVADAGLPRCMSLIEPADVVRAVRAYLPMTHPQLSLVPS